jgi:hypothetical protein
MNGLEMQHSHLRLLAQRGLISVLQAQAFLHRLQAPHLKSHPVPPPKGPGTNFVVHGQKKKVPNIKKTELTDSEAALFAGLEEVRGPNWATILQLYGPGGSKSEALKDRSQVQLKDKARNLKLFFLKGGHPVPPILNLVTGRLKGEKPDESTGRRKKRARLGLDGIDASQEQDVSQTAFTQADWTPSQEHDFTEVSPNVDPGLAMPQGN